MPRCGQPHANTYRWPVIGARWPYFTTRTGVTGSRLSCNRATIFVTIEAARVGFTRLNDAFRTTPKFQTIARGNGDTSAAADAALRTTLLEKLHGMLSRRLQEFRGSQPFRPKKQAA